MGDGYWSGWRLTVTYPEARIGFEIGRPQPSSSVGIAGGALVSDAWQHVAASWDGKQMRLYLNGLPIAHGPYDGVYTPASQLRIGFANAGVGSLKLDMSEVTAYDQALDPLAVLEAANAPVALPDADRAAFRQALDALGRGDLLATATDFRAAGRLAGLPPVYRAVARLGLAEALLGLNQPAQAAAEYAALVDATDIPDNSRQEAGAALRNLLLRGAAGDLSPVTLDLLYRLPGATACPAHGGLVRRRAAVAGDGRLCGGAKCSATGCWRCRTSRPTTAGTQNWNRFTFCARAAIGRPLMLLRSQLARQPNVPGEYGSVALLAVARSAANAGQYALARAVFQEAAALPNVPPHHAEEARQGLREVARIQAGQPAEDPSWSRVQLPPEPNAAVVFYVAVTGKDADSLERRSSRSPLWPTRVMPSAPCVKAMRFRVAESGSLSGAANIR